jgi:hypothetical protein
MERTGGGGRRKVRHCRGNARQPSRSRHDMTGLRRADVERLTVKELRACAHGRLKIPNDVGQRKERLAAHVLCHAYGELQEELEKTLLSKSGRQKPEGKRRHDEEHTILPARNPPYLADDHDPNRYLDLPSDVEVKSMYKDFYEATSNHAVKRLICGVCAREWGRKDAEVKEVELTAIPNAHCLKPEVPHVTHDLYKGMLLHPDGVHVDETSMKTIVNVCSPCGHDL